MRIPTGLWLLPLLASVSRAAMLEVRGRLNDSRGAPQDGACLLRFSIHGLEADSPERWSDSLYADVEEGLFRVMLGKERAIPDAALDSPYRVVAEAPRGTGWQAVVTPLPEGKHPSPAPKRAKAPPPPPPADNEETAKLKARIEALERQLKPSEAPKERKARVYEVRPGDTLQSIAAKLWGDSSRWSELYAANADRIARGGDVAPGQRLIVPEVDR